METVTLQEARHELRVSYRTLRKWMGRLEIEAKRHDRDWRFYVLSAEHVAAIRTARAEMPPASPARYGGSQSAPRPPAQVIQALAPATTESLLGSPPRHIEQETPRRQRTPVATRPIGSTSELPDGLLSWRAFATLHAIPTSTVQKARDDGRLPVIAGKWKQGRNYIEGTLDAAGQHQFVRLWGHRPDFAACPDCPHPLHARAPDVEHTAPS